MVGVPQLDDKEPMTLISGGSSKQPLRVLGLWLAVVGCWQGCCPADLAFRRCSLSYAGQVVDDEKTESRNQRRLRIGQQGSKLRRCDHSHAPYFNNSTL